jgi:ABC-2 type transport system ATP-binding protein
LTTQYLDEVDQLADRIAVIDHGKIVAEGTANELKASIGTTTLHLRLAQKGDIPVALNLVERILGAKGVVTDELNISAPMKAPDDVAELLVALRDANIGLSEISVQKPTLDEVFLAITGVPVGEDRKEAPDEK